MSTTDIEKANRYFIQMTKKVYIERLTKIESFEQYLNYRYRDLCHYYSAYALMGLNPDDFLVRGYIISDGRENYRHGWVEFKFEENEYVFDSKIIGILPKQKYYEKYNPRVYYKKTQREILDEYLNERCAFKIQNGFKQFWQFKYTFINADKDFTYDELISYDKNNGYIISALTLSRIVISCSEIIRFIAYAEPSI